MTTYWSLVAQRAAEEPNALLVADDAGNLLTAASLRYPAWPSWSATSTSSYV